MSSQSDQSDTHEFRRTRPLRRSGGSTVLTIPPEIGELVGLETGDDVVLEVTIGEQEILLRQPNHE